jgi:phage-related protein
LGRHHGQVQKAVDAAEAHIKNFITKSVSGLLQLFGATKTEADAAGKAVGNAFSSATGVVKSAIDTWVGALAELYPLAKKVAGAIASVVSGVLSGDIAKGNAKGWWSAIVDAAKDAANEIQKAFSIGVFHYLETELGNVLKIIKTTLGVLFPNIKAAVDVAVPIIDSTVRGVAKTSSDFNAPFVPGAMVPIFAPSTVASKTADRAPNYVQPIVTQTAHVTATINVPAGTTAKEAEGYVADGFGKAWESIRYHTGSALTPAIQY